MKINGRLVYLAGVVVACLSALLYLQSLSSDSYCLMMGVILGYFFGNERGVRKEMKNNTSEGTD